MAMSGSVYANTRFSSSSTDITNSLPSLFSIVEPPDDAGSIAESIPSTSSVNSDTTSISASQIPYLHLHNHRYDAHERSLLPNDASEQSRLDFQHLIFKHLLDHSLAATPLSAARRILDIGTGTGVWAIDVADALPSATILGIDVAPIQPTWVPPNVRFELDDATRPWLRPPDTLDFVHVRSMAGSVRDWPALLGQAFQSLRPGGVVEVSEIRMRFECQDRSLEERGRTCRAWEERLHKLAEERGWDLDPIMKVASWLEDAGFEQVRVLSRLLPVGRWPKDARLKSMGVLYLRSLLEGGLENYSMMLFAEAGWEPVEVFALLDEVKREIQDPRMHSFTRAYFVTAMKAPVGSA